MNPEEIIAMAKEAGFGLHMDLLDDPHLQANAQRFLQKLERFAALVAAKEREACAQVCDAERQYFGGVAAGPMTTDAGKRVHDF